MALLLDPQDIITRIRLTHHHIRRRLGLCNNIPRVIIAVIIGATISEDLSPIGEVTEVLVSRTLNGTRAKAQDLEGTRMMLMAVASMHPMLRVRVVTLIQIR